MAFVEHFGGLPGFDFASYIDGVWDLRRVIGGSDVIVERANFTVQPASGLVGGGDGAWLARAAVHRLVPTGDHYEPGEL